jgi:DNA-binding beta-propeller fold protein YncE
MPDLRERLSRRAGDFEPSPDALARVLRRASLRRRARAVATAITALGVFALAAVVVVAAFGDADHRHVPDQSPGPTSEPAHVPGHLGALVAAHDSLWAIGSDSRRRSEHYLVSVDPATGDILASTPVPGGVFVTPTTDRLWVSTFDLGALVEIDPQTMEIVRTIRLGRIGVVPYLATDGGAIFVIRNTDVLRLDPGARAPVVLAHLADISQFASPAGIAYLDGSVWVASGTTGEVFRLDARTGALRTTIRGTASGETAGVGAAGGYVWAMGPSSLLRIDPATNETTRVPAGSPYGIAEGAGAVWVADTEHLWKIDAESGNSVQMNGGGHPLGVAVTHGWAWVTNGGETLVRLPAA